MSKKIFLSLSLFLFSSSVLPNTFQAIEAKYPRGKVEQAKENDLVVDFNFLMPKVQLTLSYEGKIFPLSKGESLFISMMDKSLDGKSTAFFQAFRLAAELKDQIGQVRRVLLQAPYLDAFHNEIFEGGMAIYQIRVLGYSSDGPVYGAVEFQAEPSRWQASEAALESGCNLDNQADCFVLGIKLMQSQLQKAIQIFKRACKAGHQTSCFELGKYYRDSGNSQKENEYFLKACEGGHMPLACNNYAWNLDASQAVDKRRLFERACQQGLQLACNNLAAL